MVDRGVDDRAAFVLTRAADLALPELGFALPLAALFDDVAFPPPPGADPDQR
jgi:hypothetical protein